MIQLSRRHFLAASAAAAAVTTTSGPTFAAAAADQPYKISLAEWSLHRTLRDDSKNLTNLDFPGVAKNEFGIDAVEYVNQFFADKANDAAYLKQLNDRCDSEGVRSLLIMIDGEGDLGNPSADGRSEAVKKHHKWVTAAKTLGCHSIRVNARSSGSYMDQLGYAADGLRSLSEFAKDHDINVIVENHGGLSSNAAWLAVVIERVGMDNCGTLPDFGNFYITRGKNEDLFDRYKGVQALMPYAKAVSAKTYDFDPSGNESTIDYRRMMQIVTEFGYDGYVGIEYEGSKLDEYAGIKASKALLEKVAGQLA